MKTVFQEGWGLPDLKINIIWKKSLTTAICRTYPASSSINLVLCEISYLQLQRCVEIFSAKPTSNQTSKFYSISSNNFLIGLRTFKLPLRCPT